MKSRNSLPLAALLFLISLPGCTGHSVTRVPSGTKLKDQKVYYALPRTVLALEAPVALEKRDPGKCEDLLDQNLCKVSGGSVSFRTCLELGDLAPDSKFSAGEMTLSTRTEPDLDQLFQVDVRASALKKSSVVLELSEAGLLISGTSESRNRAAEIGVGLVKSLAGIAGTLITRGAAPARSGPEQTAHENRCSAIAQKILAIRKDREDLLTRVAIGPDAPPAETVKLVLDRGLTLETKLLQSFIGKIDTTAGKVLCEVRPSLTDLPNTNSEKTYALFEVSETTGLKLLDQTACRAPEAFVTTAAANPVTVKLTVGRIAAQYAESLRAAEADKAVKTNEEQGFYYRVPAEARIEVVAEKAGTAQKVLQDRKGIAQLGLVTALPRQRSVYTKYDIALYEQSGALKKLTTNAEGVDPSTLSGIADAAKTVIDADATKAKAEAAAADELARLTRERQLLEEKKKIRDLQKELEDGEN